MLAAVIAPEFGADLRADVVAGASEGRQVFARAYMLAEAAIRSTRQSACRNRNRLPERGFRRDEFPPRGECVRLTFPLAWGLTGLDNTPNS